MSRYREFEEEYHDNEGVFPDSYYEFTDEDSQHQAHVRKLLDNIMEQKRLEKVLREMDDDYFEFDED